MVNFDELAKNYIETLDDLLEQDEDIEVNSVNELIEKFNDYEKIKYSKTFKRLPERAGVGLYNM